MYLIKSSRLTDAEKDIKEQEVTNFQQNETIVLEMNVVNDEIDNTLKQSSNYFMKTPARENERNKLENSPPQIENPVYTENKIRVDEMKRNIISELENVINIDMKDSVFKRINYGKNLTQIKLANYAIEDLLQDFTPNITL